MEDKREGLPEEHENLQSEAIEQKKKPGYGRGVLHGILYGVFTTLIVIFIACGIRYFVIKNTAVDQTETASDPTEASSDASGDWVSETSVTEVLDDATLEKMNYLISLINTYYYDGMDVSEMQESLISGLIEGIGDKYTEYYTAEEYTQLMESTTGSYAGIGATLYKESDDATSVTIGYVYKDSPAENAGVEAGDQIVAVDGEAVTSDEDASDIATAVRGDIGTTVTLTILRDGETFDVEIERAEVEIETVEAEMMDDGVGYLRITQFATNTTEQFEEALVELQEEGMTSLVIDLRDNGGGVVQTCADILDDLLPEGVVVYTEDKNGNRVDYTSDEETQLDIPMVVLINGNSASASEIFAAAIADYGWGTLLGTTTYGKGVYQSVFELTDGSGIKITIGKFYSPNGNNFNGVGITPDVELEYENTAGDDADYSYETDNQLQKAIELLTEDE